MVWLLVTPISDSVDLGGGSGGGGECRSGSSVLTEGRDVLYKHIKETETCMMSFYDKLTDRGTLEAGTCSLEFVAEWTEFRSSRLNC